MINNQQILVAISCITYNHKDYLRQCLDGFVMQQTNFRFVAVVHDDCSTDGTTDILREYAEKYPDIIMPIFEEENQYCKHDGSIDRVMYDALAATECKYIAMCEGDDYWTDPLKLQKQVDFMEGHEEYCVCCHRYRIYNEDEGAWEEDYVSSLFDDHKEGFSFSNKENFQTWTTKTLTVLYRRELLNTLPNIQNFAYWRDVHLNYYLLKNGEGFCLPFIGAVYRRQSGGICSPLSAEDKLKQSVLIYRELYLVNREDKVLADYYYGLRQQYEGVVRLLITRHRTIKGNVDKIAVIDKSYRDDKDFFGLVMWRWHIIKTFIKSKLCTTQSSQY